MGDEFRTHGDNRQLVHVDGRSDVGEIVSEGYNVGNVYCVGVHFPADGLCAYYAKDRVRYVDDVS